MNLLTSKGGKIMKLLIDGYKIITVCFLMIIGEIAEVEAFLLLD
jgi:hypothetical protein